MGQHKLKRTLEKIFSHPIPSDIEVKEVEHLLEHNGFSLEHSKKNHLKIKKEDKELVLIAHSHALDNKEEVVKLRHFLEEFGIKP